MTGALKAKLRPKSETHGQWLCCAEPTPTPSQLVLGYSLCSRGRTWAETLPHSRERPAAPTLATGRRPSPGLLRGEHPASVF